VAQSHGRHLGSLALGSPDARAGYSRTARQVAVLYLEVLIQQGRSIRVMDVPTCVQSPIIVQSHESEVRSCGILFLPLSLQRFRNTSADPIFLVDPPVAPGALLGLDMFAADGCSHLMWHRVMVGFSALRLLARQMLVQFIVGRLVKLRSSIWKCSSNRFDPSKP